MKAIFPILSTVFIYPNIYFEFLISVLYLFSFPQKNGSNGNMASQLASLTGRHLFVYPLCHQTSSSFLLGLLKGASLTGNLIVTTLFFLFIYICRYNHLYHFFCYNKLLLIGVLLFLCNFCKEDCVTPAKKTA